MNRREALKLASSTAIGVLAGGIAIDANASSAGSIVEAVMLTELKPGDTLVLKCREHMSDDTAKRLRNVLEEKFPGTKALVLSGGLELEVMRG